jgi:hypothetical protein
MSHSGLFDIAAKAVIVIAAAGGLGLSFARSHGRTLATAGKGRMAAQSSGPGRNKE